MHGPGCYACNHWASNLLNSLIGAEKSGIGQGDDNEGVNNGMMATKPGLEMWMDVVHVLTERYMAAASDKDRWHQHPIYQTGPEVLANATARHVIPRFVPTEVSFGIYFLCSCSTIL